MLRTIKTILVITVFLWGILGAFHNIMDWKGTMGAVGAVTSMATIEGGTESWQATSNSIVIWMGALFIMLSKLAGGTLCLLGAKKMWATRNEDAAGFAQAKVSALAGCAIIVIMLFGGFIVIAEGWFELWRSDVMRGPVLASAFRYAGLISLIALFVATRDD